MGYVSSEKTGTRSSRVVPPNAETLTPEALRKHVEGCFGKRALEPAIRRADASITDVADAASIKREHLYEVFAGARHFKAAWLYLLAPPVLLNVLDDLAASVGYELRPQSIVADDHDDDHACADLVREACETIQATTTTLADRQIDAREAGALLDELADLERAIAPMRARLRQIQDTGGVVLSMPRKADR